MFNSLLSLLSFVMSFLVSVSTVLGVEIGNLSDKANPHEYPECGLIINIDEEEDLVEFQTQFGDVYSFYGVNDYYVGDLVAVIMHDSGTLEIYDDVVVSTNYVGWVDDEEIENWVKWYREGEHVQRRVQTTGVY